MATGKSTSKRKSSSSSSHRKKPIKNASEVKKRRSRSHKRSKSKKLYCRDDSVSYSDEDSRTEDSVSISSSDSEDSYRSRRERSRTRRDGKGSNKKRVRRSSSSSGDSSESPIRRKKKVSKRRSSSSSGDSSESPIRKKKKVSKRRSKDRKDSPHGRKNKSLKRKDGSEGKKKIHQKKSADEPRRRDKSVDPASSDSQSRDEGSNHEIDRSRGRSEKREIGSITVGKLSTERDRYGYRSRSCSPRAEHSNYDSHEMRNEPYSRRLKSVIAVDNVSKEVEGDNSKDDNEAEIIQEYDDYPSPRSNDSYDRIRHKDSSQCTHVSEKKRKGDDPKIEEALTSKVRVAEVAIKSKEHAGAQFAQINPIKNETEVTNSSDKIDASSGVGELESILRQKALENLLKFRSGLNTNMKDPGTQKHETDDAVKQPYTPKADIAKPQLSKKAGYTAGGPTDMVAQQLKNVTMPIVDRKSAAPKDSSRTLDRNKLYKSKVVPNASTGVVPRAGNSASDQIVACNSTTIDKDNNAGVTTDNATQNTSPLKLETSCDDNSISKQAPKFQTFPNADLLEPKITNVKHVSQTPKATNGCSNGNSAEVIEACEATPPMPSSCIAAVPLTEEHGSKEPVDVAKGSSEFQQKTMSVMRGGELVQVSYKVYIPKKPPALARRKLQR